ncbi:MAG TPA: serine/threonine protein phosphatase [Nitrospirae bacterium]|nr:serine/threonine protein phosphatase [Nitrospirota bacterium]
MRERTLVIGDIHGEYHKLIRVLQIAGYSSSDRLVFLGDYLNRGHESREVLEYLIELKKDRRNIFLRGNHEDVLLKLLSGDTQYWYTWLEYGEGRACISSYGDDPDRIFYTIEGYFIRKDSHEVPLDREETIGFLRALFPRTHIEFLRETVLTYELKDYFFSHAGIESGMALEEQGPNAEGFLLWGDEDFLHDHHDYGKKIVYGHYHNSTPLIHKNKICLALKGAIALLDTSEGVIYDSLGRSFSVRDILSSVSR